MKKGIGVIQGTILSLCAVTLLLGFATGCGKKGDPIPPEQAGTINK